MTSMRFDLPAPFGPISTFSDWNSSSGVSGPKERRFRGPQKSLVAEHSLHSTRPMRYDFFFGTPFGWQSWHFTRWMLCRLSGLLNVVSIFSTSSPQFDNRGWQLAQDWRVCWLCF